MFQKDFQPVLRFLVVSDIHFGESGLEQGRMKRAYELAYDLCEKAENYKKLDAFYVVGDFATRGTRPQMEEFKKLMDEGLKPETKPVLMMASHEWMGEGGEQGALERFDDIFKMAPDNHEVINGFHFISVTTTRGCNFSDEKVAWSAKELKKAREDNPKAPIFFFQHPHISDTVYGSINWGEDALYATLMDYPQVIDFSGHSHAPINDPRSIHQKHFTSLGTGSLSYFELDEFDKLNGTVPDKKQYPCAQMTFVEADKDGRVRVYPYDILTESFFPQVWEIDTPWDTDSFKYTERKRRVEETAPFFPENYTVAFSDIKEDAFTLTFPQASTKELFINDYVIKVKEADTGLTVKQVALWSGYVIQNIPEKLSVTLEGLKANTAYKVYIKAGGFFDAEATSKAFDVKTE